MGLGDSLSCMVAFLNLDVRGRRLRLRLRARSVSGIV